MRFKVEKTPLRFSLFPLFFRKVPYMFKSLSYRVHVSMQGVIAVKTCHQSWCRRVTSCTSTCDRARRKSHHKITDSSGQSTWPTPEVCTSMQEFPPWYEIGSGDCTSCRAREVETQYIMSALPDAKSVPPKNFTFPFVSECNASLGMADGRIRDTQLSASSNSIFRVGLAQFFLAPRFGRLNGPYGWCSQVMKEARCGRQSNMLLLILLGPVYIFFSIFFGILQSQRSSMAADEYFQIEFSNLTLVTAIATQVTTRREVDCDSRLDRYVPARNYAEKLVLLCIHIRQSTD